MDLGGVVDDVDVAAQCAELLVAPELDGAGFFAGGFEFDVGGGPPGEDDESVGHSGHAG
ncbi:hypothetical protein HOU24_gp44 [Corynebacterium phage SamW]|uniref:Uncharacterized protein n=2 Tax=Samwavirus samW TaxID=2734273 RepID=A0A385UH90_9CAUD|nr:hypothetical protein HOU24_gp44 [Corynebacterium phage SamW]AYB70526.1 hypothetical protein SAMW_44 [Corynebacterium phage SamW]AYQ98822.1 hypothetical protein TROY_44 [Corynebacterium phage Troy]